jgi:hypothetical protein
MAPSYGAAVTGASPGHARALLRQRNSGPELLVFARGVTIVPALPSTIWASSGSRPIPETPPTVAMRPS